MTIEQFAPQIESIATYAKAINFSFETGSIDDLMRSWINRGLKMNNEIENNREDVIRLLKSLVNSR